MTLRSQMLIFTYLLKFLWGQFTVHGRWLKIRNHLFHWMKKISFAKCPEGKGREVNKASNKTFRGQYCHLQGNPLGGQCLKLGKLGEQRIPSTNYIVSSPQPLIFKIIKIIFHSQKISKHMHYFYTLVCIHFYNFSFILAARLLITLTGLHFVE